VDEVQSVKEDVWGDGRMGAVEDDGGEFLEIGEVVGWRCGFLI
jgi:hypothetical protein